MTITQLVLFSTGIIVNAGTFVLGILVGCSLMRKESHDRDRNKATEGSWHQLVNADASRRTGCGKGRCAHEKPEADSAQRAAERRQHHGE